MPIRPFAPFVRRLTTVLVVTSAVLGSACRSSSDEGAAQPGEQTERGAGDGAANSAIPKLPRFGDAADRDSGPPLVVERAGGALLLTVNARSGDQINALLPPFIKTTNGRRLDFGGSAVTADSAYFIGAVTARVADSLLPLTGTLHTSYCRAGENLCRSAQRAVQINQ
ncbi:MAG: hypothetical protein IBJ03_08720 [Gemmatimonadaceae bacterium]|nr:hypothetical protein [Gemmatimonadaceae bacterium]